MTPRSQRITARCRVCDISVYTPISAKDLIPLQAYCNSPHAAKGFCELRLVKRKTRKAWVSGSLDLVGNSWKHSAEYEKARELAAEPHERESTARFRFHGTQPHTATPTQKRTDCKFEESHLSAGNDVIIFSNDTEWLRMISNDIADYWWFLMILQKYTRSSGYWLDSL